MRKRFPGWWVEIMALSIRIVGVVYLCLVAWNQVGCGEDGVQSVDPGLRHEPIFLPLPERQGDAMRRDDMIHLLESMSLRDRKMWIHREFMSGNVPDSSRRLVPIVLRNLQENGSGVELTLWVTADYLSLGSDDESLLMPMTPVLAQRLANMLGCSLPTPRMVDSIWEAAELKLAPQPIPPGEKMATIQVFAQHDQMIKSQLAGRFPLPEKNRLIAGHKKDVVIIPELDSLKNKVVIYGWHQLSGLPIQPVYSGHIIWYADYSHGIRLVWNTCLMNGKSTSLESILKNSHLGSALSKAARPMTQTAYPTDLELYPEPGSPE